MSIRYEETKVVKAPAIRFVFSRNFTHEQAVKCADLEKRGVDLRSTAWELFLLVLNEEHAKLIAFRKVENKARSPKEVERRHKSAAFFRREAAKENALGQLNITTGKRTLP